MSDLLAGLFGAIGLHLSTDKSTYTVGDSPVYTLYGALPGSSIAWSSFKNGQPTGEYTSAYGQTVDADGSAVLTGGPFTADQAGSWEKIATVYAPDGSITYARTAFGVQPAIAAGPTVVSGSGLSSIFSAGFTVGGVHIPFILALGVGYLVIKGKR